MSEEKIAIETASNCRIPNKIASGGPCQLSSCGEDDYSNYNPMKMVIA